MEVFPNFDGLKQGSRFDMVGRAIVISANGDHLFRTSETPGSLLLIRGDLPNPVNNYVFVGLKLVREKQRIIGCIDDNTKIFPEKPCELREMHNIVELCCGMGAFSSMGPLIGFQTLAGVDQNDKWKQIWENGHSQQSDFYHGDVGDPKIASQLLEKGCMHATLLSGVSCQPYSLAGDGRGMDDERSDSLPKTLKMAWLLQCPVVLLECVPGVYHNDRFQQVLKDYCSRTGCHLTQQIVHLSHCWSAKRDRWFGCISANVLGPIHIADLPKIPQFQQIGQVMPSIIDWSSADMEQLKLSLYELGKFDEFVKGGIEQSYIDLQSHLPTVLHSNGNQLYPCSCGCRPGLSLQRLKERGLFGTIIPLPTLVSHGGRWRYEARYLHPKEVFLLNGGLPSMDFGCNMRLGLAAVGQCVSPIQALWVLSHVSDHLNRFVDGARRDHERCLNEYIASLLKFRDEYWIPQHDMCVEAPASTVAEGDDDDTHEISIQHRHQPSIVFRAKPSETVCSFLQAESKLQGEEMHIQDVEMVDGGDCEESTVLQQGRLRFVSNQHSPEDTQVLPCPCQEWIEKEAVITPTIPFQVEQTPGSQIVSVPALSKVGKDGLLGLIAPKVTDENGLASLRNQCIGKECRKTILNNQHTLWADDEISHFLNNCMVQGPEDQKLTVWSPMILTSVINTGDLTAVRQLASALPEFATVISAVVIEGHWNPIVWRITAKEVLGFTCGLKHQFSMALQFIHGEVCRIRDVEPMMIHNRHLGFVVDDYCGAMVLCFMHHMIWGESLPVSKEVLGQHHAVFRDEFISQMETVVPRPWMWGQGVEEWESRLSALLQDHGVPLSAIEDRIKFMKSKLGVSQIEAAMKLGHPWKELKWLANRCTPIVQLIKPSELQQALDRKIKAGESLGNRSQKQKGKGKGKGPPQMVDPQKLRVENGLFVCGDGIALSQIDVSQMGPTASGVVLCSAATAAPYLKGNKQISAGGLAMVVLSEGSNLPHTSLISEKVRLPLLCTANSEPVLADGYLYQLGAMPVTRQTREKCFELISISSCVIKVAVYKDQCDVEWSQFISHPLKHIFAKLPVLQACQDEECNGSCEMWHVTPACSIKDPILELWGRQFLKINFVHSSPEEAELFTAHIRLPSCVQQQVQTYSGTNGLFVEPKAVDGRQPSPLYQVIWLPKATIQELVILRQTQAGICGLARLGSKMGVRCKIEDAIKLHQAIKPGSAFLPPGKKLFFLLGPVPFGTLKESIAELCSSINWTARPVQPVAGARHFEGIMWKVQALESPSQHVIVASHGEVLITKMADQHVHIAEAPKVVGSEHTMQLCSSSGRPEVDPIFVHDPWANAKKANPNVEPAAKIQTADPIEVLQQRVVDSVLQQLPKGAKDGMEVDGDETANANERRIQTLEQKVSELHEGQCQLHNMICEQGRSHGSQIQQLQSSVVETSHQVSQFQVQFSAQLEQPQGQLDSLFKQQMHKIEEILKKPRHE